MRRAAPFVNGDAGLVLWGGKVHEGRAGRGFGVLAFLDYGLGPNLRGNQGLGFRRLFGPPKVTPRA